MTAQFPNAIATTTQLKDDAVNTTVQATTHPQAHNNVADEIVAIETELGTNPKGTYTDVKTRLGDVVVKTPSASQTITLSGDFVGLAVKANAAQNLKNLIEVQNSSGTIMAYFDKDGIVNAVGFKVAGTALASTHLTDTAQLARLASPAFTGTPTAPTPAAGDSSTKLATTAFVQALAQANIPSGTVLPYGGSTAPTGFLLADGSAVSRASFATLFGKIGTQFGVGDGSTTFNLPDMQGRMPVGLAGASGHVDAKTIGNNEGITLASRRPKHSHSVGTLSVAISSHVITDTGHTHTVTDPGHSHGVTDAGHSHTKTDAGHIHTASGGGHSHTASGSSGTQSANHTHTYSVIAATAAAGQTGGNQYYGTLTTTNTGTDAATTHTHTITVTVNTQTPNISTSNNTTGISYASAVTAATINTGTTGISATNNHTTGISLADHVATPTGVVGTTSSAPAESAAYLVLNFIIKT